MAKRKSSRKTAKSQPRLRPVAWLRRWFFRGALICLAVVLLVVALHREIDPPRTFYMGQEERRLGRIDHIWVPIEDMAPVMARAVVAAEDRPVPQEPDG